MIKIQSNSRLIGYARVSTTDQDLCLQIDALRQHGVKKEHLFCDKISGAKEDRPGLAACNETLRKGDTLVVWRLDRLGRSMRHLVNMIEELKERGIGFRSISDGMIDTTSASGELVLNIFSALAQFERRLIQERTKAGLAAARARGRIGGRPVQQHRRCGSFQTAFFIAWNSLWLRSAWYSLCHQRNRFLAPCKKGPFLE